MDIQRAARLDSLFERALDLPESERRRFLGDECADDPTLMAEVERLLGHLQTGIDDLLEPVQAFVAEISQEVDDALGEGEVMGAYRIVGQLGRGGMGIVYLAERSDKSFERRVALKVMAGAKSSSRAIRRFEQERQILARLDHPRIARLLDGGVDPRGLPYLVLELVEGEPIDRWCDQRRAGLEERLRLVIDIAGAVQAAHQRLVVHRDLKPSNLLVTAEGEVKLLDFGIAKLLDAEGDTPGLTAADGRPMTPTYASPEQVNAEPITTASDIYQLGLLLYELVTGLRPQASSTESLSELVELVCRKEPAPPSRAVLAPTEERELRAARRGTSPEALSRRCRADLDAIVARALAKVPAERYESAAALARDLERFLNGQPVEARRASATERLGKWTRRNPALAAAAALLAVTTVGYSVAVTFQARAIERQRVRAQLEAQKATEVERFVLGLFESSDPEQALGRDVPASELLKRGRDRVERELAGQPEVQARLLSSLGAIYGEIGELVAGRELLERALAQQQALPGDQRLELAETRQRLAIVLSQSGRYDEAKRILEPVLATHRELLPRASPAIARDLAQLGIIERALGHPEVAEGLHRESLDVQRQLGNQRGVALGLNNLGVLALIRGELGPAETYFREALVLQRSLLGPRHPQVALVLFNLGATLRRAGRIEKALPLLEEALSINLEVYDENHLTVQTDRTQLAFALQQTGDFARAETLYASALAVLRAKLPAEDGRRTDAELQLGQMRVRQGRFAEAESLLTALLRLRSGRGLPLNRPERAAPLWLGRALAGQGRHEAALAQWRSGLATLKPGADDDLRPSYEREIAAAGDLTRHDNHKREASGKHEER